MCVTISCSSLKILCTGTKRIGSIGAVTFAFSDSNDSDTNSPNQDRVTKHQYKGLFILRHDTEEILLQTALMTVT